MKKTLAILVVMTFTLHAAAQLTIIPKAGVTLSKWAMEEDEHLKSKIGFTVGVGLNYQINDMFSVQPELQFIQKGLAVDESESVDGYNYKYEFKASLNYIELPILVKTTFGADNFKFFLNAGPSIGIGLGGKADEEESLSGGGFNESYSESYKIKFGEPSEDGDLYLDNRIDFGLQFGGGFLISNKIMIDIRYGLGLTSLVEDEDIKNRVIQFTVGIPLSIN